VKEIPFENMAIDSKHIAESKLNINFTIFSLAEFGNIS